MKIPIYELIMSVSSKFLLFFSKSSEGLAQSMAVNPCSCPFLYLAPSNYSQKLPLIIFQGQQSWLQRAKSLLLLFNLSLTHISSKLISKLGSIFCPSSFFYFIFYSYTVWFARPQPGRVSDEDTTIKQIMANYRTANSWVGSHRRPNNFLYPITHAQTTS